MTKKKYLTRDSPPYPANDYCGKKKKGNDGNMYLSTPDKNGICKWIKVTIKVTMKTKKTKKTKKSPLDLFDVVHVNETQFKKVVEKSNPYIKSTVHKLMEFIEDIRKTGKIAHIVPLPLSSGGIYWTDYSLPYIEDIYGEFDDEKFDNYMYFNVYLNQKGTEIDTRDIAGNFSPLNKVETIKLLDKHLKNRYTWSGNNKDAIRIHLKKI